MNDDPDKKRGLYGKFFVQRLGEQDQKEELALISIPKGLPDGLVFPTRVLTGLSVLSPEKHKNCPYIVLDTHHDKFSYYALLEYVHRCRSEYPQLADDLAKKLDEMRARFNITR